MDENNQGKIEPAELHWEERLILICSKCGKKMEEKDSNPTDNIKSALKTMIREQGFKRKMRVVTSSCLDVCPKDRIAIAVAKIGKKTFEGMTVEPSVDIAKLFEKISE